MRITYNNRCKEIIEFWVIVGQVRDVTIEEKESSHTNSSDTQQLADKQNEICYIVKYKRSEMETK